MFLKYFLALNVILACANGNNYSVNERIEKLEESFWSGLSAILNTTHLKHTQKQQYSQLLLDIFMKELGQLRILKRQEDQKFLNENKELLKDAKVSRQRQIENDIFRKLILPKEKGSFFKDFHTFRY
jgi:hypothetical protein